MMADLRILLRRSHARLPLRAAAALVVIGLAAAVGLARRESAGKGASLSAAAAFVDSLVQRTAPAEHPRDVAFGDAVALGYLERLRLGLGSPFRPADPQASRAAPRQVR